MYHFEKKNDKKYQDINKCPQLVPLKKIVHDMIHCILCFFVLLLCFPICLAFSSFAEILLPVIHYYFTGFTS